MPYSYHKQGDKYVVTKKDTGKVVGHTKGTKEALKKYLAALHINANEGKMNTMKKSELKEMIQEIIKEVLSESSTPKHKIIAQLLGPDFFLSKKPESTWDEKDHDLFNRISKMASETGKVPKMSESVEKFSYKSLVPNKVYRRDTKRGLSDPKLNEGLEKNFNIGDKVKVNDREGFKELVGLEGIVVGKENGKLGVDFGKKISGDGFATHNLDGLLPTDTGLGFFDRGWATSKIDPRFDIRNLTKVSSIAESVDYDTAVAYRITTSGNRDEVMAKVQGLLDNLTTGKSSKFPEVKVTMIASKGNPNDIILKLNGPGAFSMSKDIKARPELKGVKVSTYKPQLTKVS
jgi:hypothetical protein